MKVLYLFDFIRLDHFDDELGFNYPSTPNGKVLKKLFSQYANLKKYKEDYFFDYVYTKVPEPIYNDYGKVIKYTDVKLSDAKPYMDALLERVKKLNPDIIIPTGKLGTKLFLNSSSIGKVRGIPERVEIGSCNPWIIPTYSIEYTNVNMNAERFVVKDLELVGKYKEMGDKAFESSQVSYELITSLEKVRNIFNTYLKNPDTLVAWDLETTSLKPYREGSKALVLSLSWEEGQGVTIPLYKEDFSWDEPNAVEEILNMMREWQKDKDTKKVGHNIKYDIQFLMETEGFTEFENNYDTRVGWYLAVTQETGDSRGLSDLAYETTDMGGYDKPLEDFKKWYKNELLKVLEKELKVIVDSNKKIAKKEYDIKVTDYPQWSKTVDLESKGLEKEELSKAVFSTDNVKEALQNSPEYLSLSDTGKEYVISKSLELINKFKKSTDCINEVDGGDFSYDWFPLELMHPYASGDVDCCIRIYNVVIDMLNKQDRPKALDLLHTYYPEFDRALARMQMNGMYTDREYMKDNEVKYREAMEELSTKMRDHWAIKEFEETRFNLYQAGLTEFTTKKKNDRDPELVKYRTKFKDGKWKFSPSSGDNKGEVLFKILGLSVPAQKEYVKDKPFEANKKNLEWSDFKTNRDTIKKALEDASEDAKELGNLLIDYANLQTKYNSFVKKFPILAEYDGKIHGGVNSIGTSTSRASSSNPNL